MPKYKYRCADCDIEFVAYHSIGEKMSDCSYCGIINSLIRVPGTFVSSAEKRQEGDIGSLTRETIEEFRRDLKRQRAEATEEVYD